MSFSENKITKNNLTDQKLNLASQMQLFDLPSIDNKRVELSFTGQDISSDGGLLLVKEVERQIGIIKAITSCMVDDRHQGYVQHSFQEIAAQRVYQIIAGYEDANACNKLRNDTLPVSYTHLT